MRHLPTLKKQSVIQRHEHASPLRIWPNLCHHGREDGTNVGEQEESYKRSWGLAFRMSRRDGKIFVTGLNQRCLLARSLQHHHEEGSQCGTTTDRHCAVLP